MEDIQHQQMGYDRAATMFTPDGHILQVEYAEKTIRLGSASIGIVCKDCVVIVADRRQRDRLLIDESANRINEIDEHIMVVFSGITSDARILIDQDPEAAGNRVRAIMDTQLAIITEKLRIEMFYKIS